MKIALEKIWVMMASIAKMRRAKLEGKNHFRMSLLLMKFSPLLDAANEARRTIYLKHANDEEKAAGIDIRQSNPKYVNSVKEFDKVLKEEVEIHDHETINLSLEDAAQLEIGVLQDFNLFIDVDSMKSRPEGAKDGKKGKKKGKAHT